MSKEVSETNKDCAIKIGAELKGQAIYIQCNDPFELKPRKASGKYGTKITGDAYACIVGSYIKRSKP